MHKGVILCRLEALLKSKSVAVPPLLSLLRGLVSSLIFRMSCLLCHSALSSRVNWLLSFIPARVKEMKDQIVVVRGPRWRFFFFFYFHPDRTGVRVSAGAASSSASFVCKGTQSLINLQRFTTPVSWRLMQQDRVHIWSQSCPVGPKGSYMMLTHVKTPAHVHPESDSWFTHT